MNIYYKEVNLNNFIKRRLRSFHLFNRIFPLGTGGSPEYSLRVWSRHLQKLKKNNKYILPPIVAELGPGSSLGAGICAILSGSERYYAFDVQNYLSKEKLLEDFDEILNLFLKRNENSLFFPKNILTDDLLFNSLNANRISDIRNDLLINGVNGKYIKYFAPWNDSNNIEFNSVDFIFSQCVLEHVDNLEKCYEFMYMWMKKGAFSSHLIDFQCHSFTRKWNGHWMFSEKEWQFIKGTNDWAINRLPSSKHLEYINKSNFLIIEFNRRKTLIESGISRDMLDKDFSYLDNDDLVTTFIDILIKK